MASSDASQAPKPESYGRFVHLHTHSHYSLLQALPKTKALVKATIERGMPALALTDAGNMYGTIEFFKECQKQGIKPIIGVDFYVAVRTRHDKEPRIDNKRSRLVMLAKNDAGYKNLIKLVTASSVEGFYYKPRIDKELIEKYKEGLVVISPSFSGEIAFALKANNYDGAKTIADFYKTHFGDDFYLEVTHHPEVEDHQETMAKVVEFAKKENIKIVAAHDTYYIKPTDKKARETLVSVQDQFGAKSREDNADFSFITQEQAEEYFKNFPIHSQKQNDGGLQSSGGGTTSNTGVGATENISADTNADSNLNSDYFNDDNFDPFTGEVINADKEVDGVEKFKEDQKAQAVEAHKIARGETINIEYALDTCKEIVDKCNLEIALGKWLFPNFTVESGRTADDELRMLTYAGLERRKVELTPEVQTRIDYELDVIKTKGYSPYFLVVADLLHYAHNNGILTNIRGSVAGSMVTYLTGITNVNAIEYKLPFERFLNPERPSAPDIDMDFADNRRDQMIEYSRQKYGADKVAQIGTFGTMMAKGSIRDVARAMGFPYTLGDQISKLIPMGQQGFAMTIERAIAETPELKTLYDTNTDVRTIIDMAKQIEGCARHISVHAAGVVISPIPLSDIVPLQLDPKASEGGVGRVITQYDMRSVDENNAGLLKFDFLGIKNLSQLADAVNLVDKIEGIKVDLDEVPLDDKKTFEMLARGDTEGLFQLNGSGMTRFLKELKPTTIHDINAMVALYRPGPMETIPEYIRRKNDPSLIKYEDPRMEKYLKESYGLIVYQDDLLFSAIELAGYSWLEADKFRKAVGKKIREEMAAQKEKLTDGIVKNGQTKQFAEKLWKLFEPFQAYGFNKCLTGDTMLMDSHTGKRFRLETLHELYKNHSDFKKIKIQSLNEEVSKNKLKLSSHHIASVQENGIKQTYILKTRSGREIRATDNHPFRTFSSWKNLGKLSIGEKIATPRTLHTEVLDKKYSKEVQKTLNYKSAILGYLISEGNLCHPHGVYFYSTKDDEVRDFIKYSHAFDNVKISIDKSKSAQSVYVGQIDQRKGNSLKNFIEQQGLLNKKAIEKHIPEFVYLLNKEALSIFIAKMWQGDGCISIKNTQAYYATSSKKLAYDMQHILLRLSILSTIYTKKFKYRGGTKIGYTVVVSHLKNIEPLYKTTHKHLLGQKKLDFKTLFDQIKKAYIDGSNTDSNVRSNKDARVSKLLARGTTDIIPAEVISIIRSEIFKAEFTIKDFSKKSGVSERLFAVDKVKIGYQRETILKIAQILKSETLLTYATSDIFWDEVVSITKDKKEMTYDITIDPHHNFVANDIIVHNSHAASYGNLAYKTAYMKANFPAIYMAAVLTGAHGDTEEISIYINECKRLGIPVLAPNINESFGDFTVIKGEKTGGGMDAQGNMIPGQTHDKIRFGLYSIKNFGEGIGDVIIEERKNNGPFTTLENFLDRIKDKNLNKKSLEALVKAGAMDDFGNRSVMLANTADLLEYNKEQLKRPENQHSLFGMFGGGSADIVSVDGANDSNGVDTKKAGVKIGGYGEHLRLREDNIEGGLATQTQMLAWEKELLGLYITGHPLDKYKEILAKRDINIENLKKTIEADAEEFAEKVAKETEAKSALESMDRQKQEFEEANGIASTNSIAPGLESDTTEKKQDETSESSKKKKIDPNAPKKRFNKEEWKKQMEANQPRERQVVVAGIIEEAKEIATKKDPTIKMMFLKLADFTGSIEVVVFPKTYEQFKAVLKPEACVAIKAKTSSRNGTPSLIVDTVKVLN